MIFGLTVIGGNSVLNLFRKVIAIRYEKGMTTDVLVMHDSELLDLEADCCYKCVNCDRA